MHSRAQNPLATRRETESPVSALQVIECSLDFRSLCRCPLGCASNWLGTRSGHDSLTHRFIHMAVIALEECWKNNNLARNSELDVMIPNTRESVFDGVRDRVWLVERR